jgi:hypothetical protein
VVTTLKLNLQNSQSPSAMRGGYYGNTELSVGPD